MWTPKKQDSCFLAALLSGSLNVGRPHCRDLEVIRTVVVRPPCFVQGRCPEGAFRSDVAGSFRCGSLTKPLPGSPKVCTTFFCWDCVERLWAIFVASFCAPGRPERPCVVPQASPTHLSVRGPKHQALPPKKRSLWDTSDTIYCRPSG